MDSQKFNIKITNAEEISKILDPTPTLDWEYQIEWGSEKSKKSITEIFINLKESLIQIPKTVTLLVYIIQLKNQY